MTYTYDETDLSTDLAKVRKAIGDVEEHEHYSLSDEEITANINAAASLAVANYISARDRYAKAVTWASRNAASVTADRNGVVNAMRELKEELLRDAGGEQAVNDLANSNVQVSAGMLSQDRIDEAKQDTDYPDPPFRVGMDDNPNASLDEDWRFNG